MDNLTINSTMEGIFTYEVVSEKECGCETCQCTNNDKVYNIVIDEENIR